jgi:oligogalacturonide lyase
MNKIPSLRPLLDLPFPPRALQAALALLCLAPFSSAQTPAAPAPAGDLGPSDWIDPDTGHRIIRLSQERGSRTLYFHDNSYTPEGDKLIFNTPSGVAVVDLTHLGREPVKADIVAQGGGAIMARRSREVYVSRGGDRAGRRPGAPGAAGPGGPGGPGNPGGSGGPGAPGNPGGNFRRDLGGPVYAINVDTKARRIIPYAVSTNLSCDESWNFFVVPGAVDPSGHTPPPPQRPYVPQLQRMFPGKQLSDLTPEQRYAVQKEEGLARRTLNPTPAAYTFINLKTGERRTTGYQYGNLDHQQWSPTDPNLLLYAHEGSWHEVDRTWIIDARTGSFQLLHHRTMDMEINGHEWWGFGGKMVWFDLQTPRSQDFWIAGVNLETRVETRYHLQRDWWGIHFNSSRDLTLFADDGGDPTQVAFSKDGMWINLFRVQPDGTVTRERLANMSKHNYVTGRGGIEPNVSITPDQKWVIFTGNFYGGNQVYAAEIAKSP